MAMKLAPPARSSWDSSAWLLSLFWTCEYWSRASPGEVLAGGMMGRWDAGLGRAPSRTESEHVELVVGGLIGSRWVSLEVECGLVLDGVREGVVVGGGEAESKSRRQLVPLI